MGGSLEPKARQHLSSLISKDSPPKADDLKFHCGMEKADVSPVERRFSSPEDELVFLREEVARKEQALAEKGAASERETIVLDLAPEPHDKQIESLVVVLREKGVLNTMRVVEKMNNPHLYDDFHRFLIQYIAVGLPVTGLPEKNPLWRPLHMTLFEISLPEATKEEAEKELKSLISGMEQFYAGM